MSRDNEAGPRGEAHTAHSPPTPPAPDPTLPQSPPCLLVPRVQSSRILPARRPHPPEYGAPRWLALPSAGSTTASPSAPSTKCVPVLRVPPVRVGEMVHGKGREVSCLHFALGPANYLAGPVLLRQDRGATTLKAARCCPRQEGGLTSAPPQGSSVAHPIKFSASLWSHHWLTSTCRRTLPRAYADYVTASRSAWLG